jgi:hypothetical protein
MLTPQTLCDLIVTGIENASWLLEIRKIKGQNKIEPFYACPDFWRSPFEIEFWAGDKRGVIDFETLGEALRITATQHPDIIATFVKGNFTAKQAGRFVRILFLGDEHGKGA